MKVLFVINIFLLSFPLWARDWEYYTNYKFKAPVSRKKDIFFNFEEEVRYKQGVNYYRKSSFGLSRRINANLTLGFYYGFEGKRRNNWHPWHMFWPQFDYASSVKYIKFSSSTRLERHCNKDRFRLREKLKFVFPCGRRIGFFFGDEGRIFSLFRNPYGGENETFCGVSLRISRRFQANIYYDLRRIKRGGAWHNTNCLRTDISLKF